MRVDDEGALFDVADELNGVTAAAGTAASRD